MPPSPRSLSFYVLPHKLTPTIPKTLVCLSLRGLTGPKDQSAGNVENVIKDPGPTRSRAQGHLVSEQVPNRELRSASLPDSSWRYPGCGAGRIQEGRPEEDLAPAGCLPGCPFHFCPLLSSPSCLCRDPTFSCPCQPARLREVVVRRLPERAVPDSGEEEARELAEHMFW